MSGVIPSIVCEDILGEGPHWDYESGVLHWVDIMSPSLFTSDSSVTTRKSISLPDMTGFAIPKESGGFIFGSESGVYGLESDGSIIQLCDPESHLPNNRFNDAKCDSRGRLWLGSMSISSVPNQGSLWRYADGEVTHIFDDITIGNGLGWSPDSTIFYYTDSGARTIWSFDYDLDSGTIANRRIFAQFDSSDGSPDGLSVDSSGNLWIAMWDGWCLRNFSSSGEELCRIELPVPRPTSCTFGGTDLKTLYITSARTELSESQLREAPLSGSLFSINVDVIGQRSNRFSG